MPDSTTAALASPPVAAEASELFIRPLATPAELRECVDLQGDVWGPTWTEVVPSSILQVALYVGGILIGAFNQRDELVGFVFGLTGVVDGEVIHWSHMLGVRAQVQNLGVGRLLKEAQRVELGRRGIARMSWSFDPLIAKNAHFNLNRLGARVSHYVTDMYGSTSSPLHLGLATDRLVVTWDTNAPDRPPHQVDDTASSLILGIDTPASVLERERPERLRIEIPCDIRAVSAESAAHAAQWRESVRRHFRWALDHHYEVTGVERDSQAARCYYALTRESA